MLRPKKRTSKFSLSEFSEGVGVIGLIFVAPFALLAGLLFDLWPFVFIVVGLVYLFT